MKGYDLISTALCAYADICYAVPGYPVTEIAEKTGAELVNAEKVALEYAIGDSISGRRAAVIMKNVGLNACADPLVQATTQGLVKGVVIVAGDDPGAVASTCALDSRYYGELAEVPVLEPGPDTCALTVEEAFSASEKFSRVALLRLTPQLIFQETGTGIVARKTSEGRLAGVELTMKGKVDRASADLPRMFEWSRDSRLNRLEGGIAGVGAAIGDSQIVTVYPPPSSAAAFKGVNEIGRSFFADHVHIRPPPRVPKPETTGKRGFYRTLCRECPFIPLFRMLQQKGLHVVADAGCSILAMNPPFRIAIASYGLGSAIGVAARSTRVALIGDYALLHSGIQSLIDICEKEIPLLCIVMENRCMGMTGGQDVPSPGRYVKWAEPRFVQASDAILLEELLKIPEKPLIVIVQGSCPERREHETIECRDL